MNYDNDGERDEPVTDPRESADELHESIDGPPPDEAGGTSASTRRDRRSQPGSSVSVPWDSPVLRVVLASTLLAPLGVPLVSPALPVIRDQFGVSDATASLVISAYFVVGILLSPFIGVVADRIGRRAVLTTSLIVFGVTGASIALAPDFATLLVLRAISGTAAAGIFVTTVTLLGDTFDGVQRNAVLGVNTAVLSLGAATFPLLGGALVAIAWNAPFVTYLVAVPLGVVALRVIPAVERDSSADRDSLADRDSSTQQDSSTPTETVDYLHGALRTIATRGTLALYGVAFTTEVLLFGTVLTLFPFLLSDTYGLTPLFIGLVVTVAEVASIVVAAGNGRLAGRFSNWTILAAGFVCYGIGLVGAWFASSLLVVGLVTVLLGAGVGLTMPTVDAEMSARVPATFRAGALSLRNSTTFLGRATGPILFAGLAVVVGTRPLLLGAGLVVFAIVLAALAVRRRAKPISAGKGAV